MQYYICISVPIFWNYIAPIFVELSRYIAYIPRGDEAISIHCQPDYWLPLVGHTIINRLIHRLCHNPWCPVFVREASRVHTLSELHLSGRQAWCTPSVNYICQGGKQGAHPRWTTFVREASRVYTLGVLHLSGRQAGCTPSVNYICQGGKQGMHPCDLHLSGRQAGFAPSVSYICQGGKFFCRKYFGRRVILPLPHRCQMWILIFFKHMAQYLFNYHCFNISFCIICR